MDFFHFIPLEERIVLDATLVGAVQNFLGEVEGANPTSALVSFIDQRHDFNIASTDPQPIGGIILWGDGTGTSNISVNRVGAAGNASWGFDPTSAQSAHIYKDVGVYNIMFQPLSSTGASLGLFTFATVQVVDAPLLRTTVPSPTPLVEGIARDSVLIATFKDTNIYSTANDFSVRAFTSGPAIVSNYAVVPTSVAGVYNVTATILGTDNGNLRFDLLVSDVDGAQVQPTVSTFPIQDAGLQIISPNYQVQQVEGSSLNDINVGYFKSNNPYDTANEFTVSLLNPDTSIYQLSDLKIIKDTLDNTLYYITGDLLSVNPGAADLNFSISEITASTINTVSSLTVLNAPLVASDSATISGTQFDSATHVYLGQFINGVNNDLLSGSISSSLVSASNFSFELAPVQDASGYKYNVYADLAFLQDSVGQTVNLPVTISDNEGGIVTLNDNLRVFDAQFIGVRALPTSSIEGVSNATLRFFYSDPEAIFPQSYQAVVDWGDGTQMIGTINEGFDFVQLSFSKSHTYQDVGSYNISFNVYDVASGDLIAKGSTVANVVDAPISAVNVNPVSLIEGNSFGQLLIGRFQDQNIYDNASNFSASVSGLPAVMSVNNINIVSDGAGQYSIYADLLSTDVASGNILIAVDSLEGASFANLTTAFSVSDAPLIVPLPLTITANQGEAFNGIIGSFADGNPFSLVGDFTATIDWGDGNSSLGIITANGGGGFNITGAHTYGLNPDGLAGVIHIQDVDGAMADLTFNVTSTEIHQLLWGVDQINGQLFSVSDYSLPGAENRVQLYGQLQTTMGTFIGDKILAFTIDGQDALGKNSAFIAVNKALDGINTFSIGVIADINDAASRTNVTLFKISGMSFDLATDKITSLAIDPLTGNLEGILVRGNSPATLFVLNKNQLDLNSTTHVVQAYTLGRLVSKEILGNMKVSNVQDMVFDQAHNLYVTEFNSDKLYRIDNNTGEILSIANKNEDLGIGEANIKALAYDPVLNKIVGANGILNAGMPANDLVGLSVNNGTNSLDVHLLSSLKDIQGMAFLPQFAHRSGADLGLLIDVQNENVEYKAGQGATLLLHDVNLIDFGDKSYDGASLTIDANDNGNSINDILGIKDGSGIKVNSASGEIRYQNLLIGTIDTVQNGKGGQALTIHFNANATEKAVENLMERLTFMNTSKNLILGQRSIDISIYDALHTLIAHTTVELDIEGKEGKCS